LGEDGRNECGRKDPTLVDKEIPLYGGHNKGIAKKWIFFLTIQGFIGKLQAHEEKINKVQEDMGARALFSKLSIKEKQDESGYSQGGRGHGQGRGRDRLERGG
jgi:hypothetical protein